MKKFIMLTAILTPIFITSSWAMDNPEIFDGESKGHNRSASAESSTNKPGDISNQITGKKSPKTLIITLKPQDNSIKIPCEINNHKIEMIFDTGADSLYFSKTDAEKIGLVSDPEETAIIRVPGHIFKTKKTTVKELRVGDWVINNVGAFIWDNNFPSCLGRSVISQWDCRFEGGLFGQESILTIIMK